MIVTMHIFIFFFYKRQNILIYNDRFEILQCFITRKILLASMDSDGDGGSPLLAPVTCVLRVSAIAAYTGRISFKRWVSGTYILPVWRTHTARTRMRGRTLSLLLIFRKPTCERRRLRRRRRRRRLPPHSRRRSVRFFHTRRPCDR